MSDRSLLIGAVVLGALSGLAQLAIKQRQEAEASQYGVAPAINIPGLPKLGNRMDIQCWPLAGKWAGVYICKNW